MEIELSHVLIFVCESVTLVELFVYETRIFSGKTREVVLKQMNWFQTTSDCRSDFKNKMVAAQNSQFVC